MTEWENIASKFFRASCNLKFLPHEHGFPLATKWNVMSRFFIDNEFPLAATQLSLAMFGIGATLSSGDFRQLFRTPRSLFLGTAIQMLLASGLLLLLIRTGLVAPAVVTGPMLCALAPGGSTSNVFTHLARGNTALSISITILTSFAAILTMPLPIPASTR
jgi:BASS family bile acid:Na+ symporter